MVGRLRHWLARVAMALLTLKSELCGHKIARRLDAGDSEVHGLRGHARHTHVLQLHEDELAVLRLAQRSGMLLAKVFDPHGELVAGFDGTPGGVFEFALRARVSGEYRITVQPAPHASAGEYELTLKSLDMLPKQPVRASNQGDIESPRLRALRDALRTQPTAAEAFWREIDAQAAPLIEFPSAHDALVTFVYRGEADTRDVSVQLPVFRPRGQHGALALLPGSDVWFRSEHVPTGTRLSYQLIVDADVGPDTPERLRAVARSAAARADPRNPRHFPDDPALPPHDQRSVLELAGAKPEPWLARKPDADHGTLRFERYDSARLGNARTLALYEPPASVGPPEALLIVLDGERYVAPIGAPTLLDNLVAARAIRSTAAVFVYNVSAQGRVEELTCKRKFADFLAYELLPFVRERLELASSVHTVIAGASLGGLTAAYTAYRHPDRFGAVLSQSGSFWFWHGDDSDKYAPDWLIGQFDKHETMPIRFYLDAGALETGTGIGAIRDKNRQLRDVLRAKGYEVTYRELAGGHDELSWRADFPNGLIALLAGSD